MIFAKSFDFVLDTSMPATWICPSSKLSNRPIIMSVVDLPAPFGPMSEVNPAFGMSSVSGPMWTSSVYDFLTCSI